MFSALKQSLLFVLWHWNLRSDRIMTSLLSRTYEVAPALWDLETFVPKEKLWDTLKIADAVYTDALLVICFTFNCSGSFTCLACRASYSPRRSNFRHPDYIGWHSFIVLFSFLPIWYLPEGQRLHFFDALQGSDLWHCVIVHLNRVHFRLIIRENRLHFTPTTD